MFKRGIDILKKLFSILTKKQKRQFAWVVAAALLSAAFETLGVTIIVPLVNVLLTPEALFKNELMKPVISLLGIETNRDMIVTMVVATIVLYIIKNGYSCFYTWVKAVYSSNVQREGSVYMMKSYMNRGYTYFVNKNTNEVIQGVVTDIQNIYTILNNLIYIITKSLIILMIGVYMIYSDWKTCSALMVAAVICLVVIVLGFKKYMKKVGIWLRQYTIDANQVLLQAIQGIKEVLVTRKQEQFVTLYEEHMYKRQKEDIKRNLGNETPNYIVEAFCITAIMIVLALRIMNDPDPSAFVAVLASFAVGAFRILPAIGNISGAVNNIVAQLPSLDAAYENIVESRQLNDRFYDVDVKDDPKYKDMPFNDRIEIKNARFAYSEDLGNVIDGLDLTIEKNQSVALVGESGAGKSTLADIILGILPLSEGSIYLDDVDTRLIPITWSKKIGFVPQTIFLCDASIAENVAFGERRENIDKERVREVLKMANILDFVETLPGGIDSGVGDRGVRLSGGQRQRIGIARALYHAPEILILDEATSALDNDTEKTVMEAIESLQGNITMIVIAHRLTTVKNCDRIYEIKGGRAELRRYEDII